LKILLITILLTLSACASKPSKNFCNRVENAFKTNNIDDLVKLYEEHTASINATKDEKEKAFIEQVQKCDI